MIVMVFFFHIRVLSSYRTFFLVASSPQEARDWIKILRWKLVNSTKHTCMHTSNMLKYVYFSHTKLAVYMHTIIVLVTAFFNVQEHPSGLETLAADQRI